MNITTSITAVAVTSCTSVTITIVRSTNHIDKVVDFVITFPQFAVNQLFNVSLNKKMFCPLLRQHKILFMITD